ncbi:MAG TPA: hypothetical protein DCL44_02150 [Elusimicrobia bacterium]|nr:hypothetical protein [Elusimicrobiota bacterium]
MAEIKYNVGMPVNKRYKVRFRVKVRNQLLRRSRLSLGILLAVALAAYGGFKSFGAISGFSPAAFFSFRLKELKLNCPAPSINKYARGLFSARQGKPLSSADCDLLAFEIKKRHLAVRDVLVRRNFFSGEAAVTIRLEPVVSPVFLPGGATAYLSESGKLLTENFSKVTETGLRTELYGRFEDMHNSAADGDRDTAGRGNDVGGEQQVIRTQGKGGRFPAQSLPAASLSQSAVTAGRIRRDGGFVEGALPALSRFISEMGLSREKFSSPPTRLEYQPGGKFCRLFLENGCEVLWGEFEFTRLKILRLNEVLEDVSLKLKFPVSVDLRFFKEGRIFVSRPPTAS